MEGELGRGAERFVRKRPTPGPAKVADVCSDAAMLQSRKESVLPSERISESSMNTSASKIEREMTRVVRVISPPPSTLRSVNAPPNVAPATVRKKGGAPGANSGSVLSNAIV